MPKLTDDDWAIIESIPGYMSREECDWLASLASSVRSWTEIGVYAGRSMLATGLHLQRNGMLQLVDIAVQPQFKDAIAILELRRPDVCWGLSPEGNPREARKVAVRTEVVFIDGNHEHPAVVGDIQAWGPRCRTLCGHDITFPRVARIPSSETSRRFSL